MKQTQTYFNLYRVPEMVSVQTATGWYNLLSVGEGRWQGRGLELNLGLYPDLTQIVLTTALMPILRVKVRWNFEIKGNLYFLGDHWERGYGDLEWRGLVPERIMPWYFLVHDGQFTHGYGVKTGAAALCFWQVDGSGVSLYLDVRCGDTGFCLVNRELTLATLVARSSIAGETSFEAASAFCGLLCDHSVLPQEAVFGGNNWYYAYGKSSHNQILEDSKLISSLAPSTPVRPFMVIDDGWQQCHFEGEAEIYNGGPWRQGNYLFGDMAKLAEEMQECGVKPGIWFRPLLTREKVPASWALSSKLAHAERGTFLDPSNPEVLELIRRDTRQLVEWGFKLIKHDFSTYDLFGRWGYQMQSELTTGGWAFGDCTRTTAEIILAFYQTIADAANGTTILACNTIGHLAAGIFALQRTGDDISGRSWERTRRMGINTLAFRMPQHRTFFSADADCVGIIGEEIDWKMNCQWLDLLSRSGTPLFVSADPKTVSPVQKKALSKAFEYATRPISPAIPLDWFSTTCPQSWQIEDEIVNFDWYGTGGVSN